MARDWEQQFRLWASPPGKTEEERCKNAVSAIRNAIRASNKLNTRNIRVFTQGSYRNRTNVRKDSDVDVGIVCTDVFFEDLPQGKSKADYSFSDSNYLYKQFKNEVGEALVSYFGEKAVDRSNKAFDVHETSYHVDADVAAFFQHRRYSSLSHYLEGIELRPDDNGSKRIINWPEQHYDNGVSKNTLTGKRYKAIARVLKSLSNEMATQGIAEADIPGFLIECLVWNVPNSAFQNLKYVDDVKQALFFLFENTKDIASCREWGEVSELKYLFSSSQKWTCHQANAFTIAAWNYAELGG
ncbi:MAG: nucleotidyltransferase [Bacteroidota bacterium]